MTGMAQATATPTESVVERIRAVYRRWRRDTPIAARRADWDALFQASGSETVEAVTFGGVPCAWVRALGVRTDKVIVYFHGGGFQIGSLASHRQLMGWLSAAAGASVLGVDYRLAPEHLFPAALDDGTAVLRGLERAGIATTDMAIAGDSAGGGLALAAIAQLARAGAPIPCAAFVMSALTDLAAAGSSYDSHASLDPIHQRPLIQAMGKTYLGANANPQDPLASPLHTEPSALALFPPVLLQVGERETLVSDSVDFAARLSAAGGRAEVQVWPGMIHVFQQFTQDLPQAHAAIDVGGSFLAARLHTHPIQRTTE